MNQTLHIGTINIRQNEFRFVYDSNGRGGVFYPILHIFWKGPNGSPAGIGPKGWPRWILACTKDYRNDRRWNSGLTFTLPVPSWLRCYKLRKIGGLKLYNLVYKFYHLPL